MRCAALVGAVFAASACGRQRGWCGLGAGCGLDGALCGAVLCGRQQADTRAARWRVCGLAGGRVATDAGGGMHGAQRVTGVPASALKGYLRVAWKGWMRCAALVGVVFAASACGRQRGWCGMGAGCGFDGALMRRALGAAGSRQTRGQHAGGYAVWLAGGWRLMPVA